MKKINIQVLVSSYSIDKVYDIISDFGEYQKYSEVVRYINILESEGNQSISNWEVNFRQGIVRWKEKDLYFPEKKTIEFEQIEGDLEYFCGKWEVKESENGCNVSFSAEFDFGIPSLSSLVEPIAAQAFEENIVKIMEGLFKKENVKPIAAPSLSS